MATAAKNIILVGGSVSYTVPTGKRFVGAAQNLNNSGLVQLNITPMSGNGILLPQATASSATAGPGAHVVGGISANAGDVISVGGASNAVALFGNEFDA